MQRSQQKDADYESGAADRAREINKDRRGERERETERDGGEERKTNIIEKNYMPVRINKQSLGRQENRTTRSLQWLSLAFRRTIKKFTTTMIYGP